jgi:hypothetical protein
MQEPPRKSGGLAATGAVASEKELITPGITSEVASVLSRAALLRTPEGVPELDLKCLSAPDHLPKLIPLTRLCASPTQQGSLIVQHGEMTGC